MKIPDMCFALLHTYVHIFLHMCLRAFRRIANLIWVAGISNQENLETRKPLKSWKNPEKRLGTRKTPKTRKHTETRKTTFSSVYRMSFHLFLRCLVSSCLLLLLRNAMTTNTFSCVRRATMSRVGPAGGAMPARARRSPRTTVRGAIAAPMAGENANGWPGDLAANGWLGAGGPPRRRSGEPSRHQWLVRPPTAGLVTSPPTAGSTMQHGGPAFATDDDLLIQPLVEDLSSRSCVKEVDEQLGQTHNENIPALVPLPETTART